MIMRFPVCLKCVVFIEKVRVFLLNFLNQSQGNLCTNTCYSVVMIGQTLSVSFIPVGMFWFS